MAAPPPAGTPVVPTPPVAGTPAPPVAGTPAAAPTTYTAYPGYYPYAYPTEGTGEYTAYPGYGYPYAYPGYPYGYAAPPPATKSAKKTCGCS
uniref:Uncharacterized protein n=1 Tax=Chromera velia CCMP2878 TaxID=1169474 RepID=A0A0G4HCB6_9ALVE|mmetsp:Transcript_19519/g.39295  ORF Transcript_19519/g.39295 Transcript_19519/m.39295 type:complete len:92 (-) Transcript_19519:818-1093(-)|eukprot:Cvel_6307.t1-p1 / transcript=Cvel_6307.t1 / gene=Cvel_6307 / organism=Chromera_velia_CCMP2878 / gene_product=hypothetical protein / transcript_product=hypothetical protein / location=Cvel_scaffold306:30877-31976(-) / protein_length=91 / sequence_SO=supercontig / SO=protein_coding / is_pseudo=false